MSPHSVLTTPPQGGECTELRWSVREPETLILKLSEVDILLDILPDLTGTREKIDDFTQASALLNACTIICPLLKVTRDMEWIAEEVQLLERVCNPPATRSPARPEDEEEAGIQEDSLTSPIKQQANRVLLSIFNTMDPIDLIVWVGAYLQEQDPISPMPTLPTSKAMIEVLTVILTQYSQLVYTNYQYRTESKDSGVWNVLLNGHSHYDWASMDLHSARSCVQFDVFEGVWDRNNPDLLALKNLFIALVAAGKIDEFDLGLKLEVDGECRNLGRMHLFGLMGKKMVEAAYLSGAYASQVADIRLSKEVKSHQEV